MNESAKIAVAACCTAMLTACGGGSGNSEAPTTYRVDTAYTQAATTGISLTGMAVDGADTWTMDFSMTPAADEVFEGSMAKKANQSITIKKNGVTLQAANGETFFTVNPYKTKGFKFSDGRYGVQTVDGSVRPNTATVGSSGSLGSVTVYASAAKSSVTMTEEGTWTLEEDTATTAYACNNIVVKNPLGAIVTTNAVCYKIDANGSIKGMKYTLFVVQANKVLTFH